MRDDLEAMNVRICMFPGIDCVTTYDLHITVLRLWLVCASVQIEVQRNTVPSALRVAA